MGSVEIAHFLVSPLRWFLSDRNRSQNRESSMRVDAAVNLMSKAYLDRVVDSFTKDFPKRDEERAREIIVKNVDELTDPDRIKGQLSWEDHKYSERVLHTYILEFLLTCADHIADEPAIIEGVQEAERDIVAAASDPEELKYEDEHALDVLEAVLDVALMDDHLTPDEFSLVKRLSNKLGVNERSKRILLARMGHFPRPDNEIHTPSEFRNALNNLQRRGVVFYANRLDGGQYLIPDEMVPGVKAALGVQLSLKAWRLLLQSLSKKHLGAILEGAGVPKTGSKEEQIERVVAVGVEPPAALEVLSFKELHDVCASLPGVNVSGSKQEKVDRIIDYFDGLIVKDVPAEASPREMYYEYLVELAHRDRENLLANKVIRKDLHMEAAFEEGLRHLFESKLSLELLPMPGSDHPDGLLKFAKSGDLFMWDAKSKEETYTFPASHLKQFKRYIRDSKERVSCFMVIVPDVADEAAHMAAKLKVESQSDTDVVADHSRRPRLAGREVGFLRKAVRSRGLQSDRYPDPSGTRGSSTALQLKQYRWCELSPDVGAVGVNTVRSPWQLPGSKVGHECNATQPRSTTRLARGSS